MRFTGVVVTTIVLIVSPRLFCQETKPESFDPRDEKLQLSVDFDTQRLDGAMTFEMVNWTKEPAADVSFILHRLMEVSSIRDGSGAALRFTQDVVRFIDEPMRQVTQVRVKLAQPVAPGARTTLRIEYSGYLTPYSEIGWLYVKDHVDTAFTILRRDALAFPEIGGISRAANRDLPSPEFTYTADVRVPSKFMVSAGGRSTVTTNADGTVTWRYVSGAASPYLNISIARFDTLNAGGVRIFYFPSDSAGARYIARSAQAGLLKLKQWFGPLHSAPNLTITEIPDGWGSQGNLVGGIIQTASAFRDTMQVGELYHELTHLWNAVDREPGPPRWNEGLATFLEDLMQEELNGWPGRKPREQRRIASLKRQFAADSSLVSVPLIDYGKRSMTGRSYAVGGLMFSTLYELVGPAEFNRIVGGYYKNFTTGATTRDFVAFAQESSKRNLSTFFNDWIYTTRWTVLLTKADSVGDLASQYRN